MDLPRRRRRRIWACSECRQRKLQCDRTRPRCKRCCEAGRASTCQYSDTGEIPTRETSPAKTNATPKSTNSAEHSHAFQPLTFDIQSYAHPQGAAQLENRLKNIESIIARTVSAQADPTSEESNEASWVQVGSKGFEKPVHFHGTSFRTRFHGSTYAASIASRIPGLLAFTEDAFRTSDMLERIRQAANTIDSNIPTRAITGAGTTTDALLCMLPSKEETDRLVGVYMEGMNHVYHILHLPQFDVDYAQIWLDQSKAEAHNILLVLLIVAIAYCALPKLENDPADGQPAPRDRAGIILDACETWLQETVARFENLREFQIHFLLLLGRQLRARRYKRTWANAGQLVRIWMCAGLQREIPPSHRATLFDKEMRRRLWAAATEFELQASFEHGMPTQAWTLQSDIRPPGNITDHDLQQPSLGLPTQAYTPTSYLAIAGESLRFRLHLNTILNTVDQAIGFEQTKAYADKLLGFIQALPKWNSPQAAVTHSLLSLNLHQYLLALYNQQLLHATSQFEKQFVRVALAEAAFKMVECHRTALSVGSGIVELLSQDHVRVALSICRCYVSADPMSDTTLMTSIEQLGLQVLDELRTLACEKVERLGGDRRHLWLICAATGMMRSNKDPAARAFHIQHAIDWFSKPYSHILGASDDLPGVRSIISGGQSDTSPDILSNEIDTDFIDYPLEDWSIWDHILLQEGT